MKVVRATVLVALVCGVVATSAGARPSHHVSRVSRANAVRQAHNYLAFEAFSLRGLAAQLKFEGYSTGDATYGANHSGANWMVQAVKKAREYLKLMPFSRSGMVKQLEFDKFTPAQARHGALAAGL